MHSFQITIEFLQHQLRGVHVVAVAEVPSVFKGVCEEDHRFQDETFKGSTQNHLCAERTILTSDHIADMTVRVDTADLFGMCWVHLPAEEESWRKPQYIQLSFNTFMAYIMSSASQRWW